MKFDQFVGRTVPVTEQLQTYAGHDYTVCQLTDESVITEIKKVFSGKVRVWLPGTMGTCDYVADRLNVHISKQGDGTYQIVEINFG